MKETVEKQVCAIFKNEFGLKDLFDTTGYTKCSSIISK